MLIFNVLNRYKELILLHIIFAILVATNFPSDKFFIGWDALNPEFNLLLNLKRAFFGFWQENYGLGLLGGHGFSAVLPHTILIALLSFVFPIEALRPIFTFLCLYAGSLGMFFLVQHLLKTVLHPTRYTLHATPSALALLSALFYMLNLGTIQIFYIQLETFIVHFAALPWLFYITLQLLNKITIKRVMVFFLISFLSWPQGFIPSLFAAYFIALTLFLGVYVATSSHKIHSIKKSATIGILNLVANAFWLIPLIYYQLTKSAVFLNSYNNLISTPHFIESSKKYGDLQNVALLKGFMFDAFEIGTFVLSPWITHLEHPMVLSIGYLVFLIILLGVVYGLFTIRHWTMYAFTAVFLFFFVSLGTNIPVIGSITTLLHDLSPTYAQAFRTAFTKFGIGLAFSYSIFFAIGIVALWEILGRFLKHRLHLIAYFLLLIALLFYSLPALAGHLFYSQLSISVPKAYFDIADYFKTQPPSRIADFPQDCPEGWYAYKWGYFGSGFQWYGVPQPFLARSFDVWSNYNENYYLEITQALREERYDKIDAIFQKYQVSWILYDPNLLYCRNQKAFLLHTDFVTFLENAPQYSLVKTFSNGAEPIKLFKNNAVSPSFVTLNNSLPSVGPAYTLTDNDQSYFDYGNYQIARTNPDVYYPFRSLFTKRGAGELSGALAVQKDQIVIESTIPLGMQNKTLAMPKSDQENDISPIALRLQNTSDTTYAISLSYLLPQIYLDGKQLTTPNLETTIGQVKIKNPSAVSVVINGEKVPLHTESGLYQAMFYNTTNTVEIFEGTTALLRWDSASSQYNPPLFNASILIPDYSKGTLQIVIPKTVDSKRFGIENIADFDHTVPYICNRDGAKEVRYQIDTKNNPPFIRFFSKDKAQCITTNIPHVLTTLGYILEVKTRNISGNAPKLSISSKGKTVYNEVFLYTDKSKEFTSHYFVVPPSFPSELGYDIRIENTSESTSESINDISGVSLWHIPYWLIQSITISESLVQPSQTLNIPLAVEHPNDTFYQVSLNNETIQQSNNPVLILSQTYDPGWKAYVPRFKIQDSRFKTFLFNALPFLFGAELKEHVMVNNWANGWVLDKLEHYSSSERSESRSNNKNLKLVIIYLPQYLQYLGFLLPISLLLLIKKKGL